MVNGGWRCSGGGWRCSGGGWRCTGGVWQCSGSLLAVSLYIVRPFLALRNIKALSVYMGSGLLGCWLLVLHVKLGSAGSACGEHAFAMEVRICDNIADYIIYTSMQNESSARSSLSFRTYFGSIADCHTFLSPIGYTLISVADWMCFILGAHLLRYSPMCAAFFVSRLFGWTMLEGAPVAGLATVFSKYVQRSQSARACRHEQYFGRVGS